MEADIDSWMKIGVVIGGTIASIYGVIVGRHHLKRQVSHEQVEAASDEAQVTILGRALAREKENTERADRAFDERNQALSQTGGFMAQIAAMELRIKDNSARLEALERERSENLSIIAGLREKIRHLEEENRSLRAQIQELTRKQNGK